MGTTVSAARREPWNKGKIVGQKAPFKLKDSGVSDQKEEEDRGTRGLIHDTDSVVKAGVIQSASHCFLHRLSHPSSIGPCRGG